MKKYSKYLCLLVTLGCKENQFLSLACLICYSQKAEVLLTLQIDQLWRWYCLFGDHLQRKVFPDENINETLVESSSFLYLNNSLLASIITFFLSKINMILSSLTKLLKLKCPECIWLQNLHPQSPDQTRLLLHAEC